MSLTIDKEEIEKVWIKKKKEILIRFLLILKKKLNISHQFHI